MSGSARPTSQERMARIEGVLEQMNEPLDHLESPVIGLRAELQTDFRWLIGFVIGTWITLMLTLIFKH